MRCIFAAAVGMHLILSFASGETPEKIPVSQSFGLKLKDSSIFMKLSNFLKRSLTNLTFIQFSKLADFMKEMYILNLQYFL